MKKTIICLGLALATFGTVAFASNVNHSVIEKNAHYSSTPLCVAISKGEIDVVKKFVEYGADVNERSNGLTPLMIAATYNKVEIIEYLLSKGADLYTKNDKGYTALKFAELSNAQEAATYLKAAEKK
ncbi:MAG TPA: ankyrin repeat domain-containing protein [Flavobacterium sp.]|nr:ankyrin repeat domain-containing protein [Flavobacterium sp.]